MCIYTHIKYLTVQSRLKAHTGKEHKTGQRVKGLWFYMKTPSKRTLQNKVHPPLCVYNNCDKWIVDS